MSIATALRSISKRSVLITGGASGLGEATGRYLAAQGANVTLVDMDASKGESVAKDIGSAAQFVKVDVCSEDDVKAAVQAAVGKYGALHGAVNCAGVAPPAKVIGKKGLHKLELYNKVVSINLIGTFNVARLTAEAMSRNQDESENGCIVNTASVAAFDGQIGQCAYASSKAGVVGLTLPLARELAEHKIRVCTIAPGIMGTPMLAGLPPAAQASLGQAVPFPQRVGNPYEYAALVHHIMGNGYLNGEVIRMDGSIRMAPK